MFADLTGVPERYLSLHFANHIWRNNLTEVMAQPETDPAVFDVVMDFARSISMDPVAVRKERSGYLLNSMLVPFLFSAMDLLVTETSTVEDIDKAWVKGAGAPYGPFGCWMRWVWKQPETLRIISRRFPMKWHPSTTRTSRRC